MKASFQIKLQGTPAANRDAVVILRNQATGAEVRRNPFLDGTLLVRDLDPGQYDIEVQHPNLVTPIFREKIRLFPQPSPTVVPVPVPPELFRDTPIRDIPGANLGPTQQALSAARERLAPIGGKAAGEVIRSADWNTLVGVVSDLAGAVLELTKLVAPQGHDHPEIAEKIGEVQENLRRFAESFGRSLLELRREIETLNLRQTVTGVLDAGGASQAVRDRLFTRVTELEDALQADTPLFTQKLTATGALLQTEINQLAIAQGPNADAFLADPKVKALSAMAQQYSAAGTQIRPESELNTYQRTTTVAGGKKFGRLFGG
jgi:hypothetical protein